MGRSVKLGDRHIGPGNPTYVVAEIGINHNGDLKIAKQLIDVAAWTGCDAVKFQKRTPELAVPKEQRDVMRETPWGYISYLDYRYKVEFEEEFAEIDRHCREKGIQWFASCWDENAVDFIEKFDPPCFKIQSAAVTDLKLLKKLKGTGRPMILSTGMSTMGQIDRAVKTLGTEDLIICHTTSTYPCPPEELNLSMIQTLQDAYPGCPIGYSGHETGLVTTTVAVALGASFVERHITLDRSMWGSDQAASVEPVGFERLVKYIRVIEKSLGDGVKKVYESEKPVIQRLRRVSDENRP